MSVSLADTNTPGLSQIKYQIDYGAWIDYTVPIAVTPGQIVSAQAISIDAGWLDSAKATQIYLSDSAQLAPPVILTSASNFGFFFNRTINVTLQNPNDPSYSELQFRIDGGAWTPYNGSFTLDRATYGGGVTIEAMAIASAGPYESYYQDSSTTAKLLGGVNVELTGTATGMFHDPTGLATMVTNLTGAAIAESSYFEWGDDTPIPGDPRPAKKSNLEFNGTGFSDLEEGTPFLIGDMDYFNGSIWADSGADTVNLGVDLNLNIGGLMLTPRFDFGLNLINTVNLETPGDPWPDADYVVIDNPTSSTQLFINDSIYEFSISFGETTPQGFALFDQFHVLEWKSANVKIYGSFTEVTP
ncbi:MAG: choice-of-anchor K domain-containing protein [Verrucomicrobiae bacterium]|nr:choice-of-anchor K domain-containing protein [Verrucomicrobiae bacterium]